MNIEKMLETKHHRKYGVHSVILDYYDKAKTIKGRIKFSYYGTPICEVFPYKKEFHVSDQGYNTVMTHKFISQYIAYFTDHGYKLTGLSVTGIYANKFASVFKHRNYYYNARYFILENELYSMSLDGRCTKSATVTNVKKLFKISETDLNIIIVLGIDLLNLPYDVVYTLRRKYEN